MIDIFPPILDQIIPCNVRSTILGTMWGFQVTLSNLTNIANIQHVQLLVTSKSAGQPIVLPNYSVDGVLYLTTFAQQFTQISGRTYLFTPNEGNNPGFNTWFGANLVSGVEYNIQIRFGSTARWNNSGAGNAPTNFTNFSAWKAQQVANRTFGEWSNIAVLKVISPYDPAIDLPIEFLPIKSIIPTFNWYYHHPEGEKLAQYRFRTVNNSFVGKWESVTEAYTRQGVLESQGFNPGNTAGYITIQKQLPELLFMTPTQQVTVDFITEHGYIGSGLIPGVQYTYPQDGSWQAAPERFDRSNALALVGLNTLPMLAGAEMSVWQVNYQNKTNPICIWNKTLAAGETPPNYVFDLLVESGQWYKYFTAFHNPAENFLWLGTQTPLYNDTFFPSLNFNDDATATIVSQNGEWIYAYGFEYYYLLDGTGQLKLPYNTTVDGVTVNQQEQSVITIGAQYPIVQRSAATKYKTFSLKSLLSFEFFDENDTLEDYSIHPFLFLQKVQRTTDPVKFDLYYNNILIAYYEEFCDVITTPLSRIRTKQYTESPNNEANIADWDTTLDSNGAIAFHPRNQEIKGPRGDWFPLGDSPDNIVYYDPLKYNLKARAAELQRKYREAVIQFLSTPTPKVFKSAHDGNLIMKPTNITFSNEGSKLRSVQNISMQLTEIAAYNNDNILKYGFNKWQNT